MKILLSDSAIPAAAVMRDHKGVFKGAAAKKLAKLQPVEAEAEAAIRGVQVAWQRGFQRDNFRR